MAEYYWREMEKIDLTSIAQTSDGGYILEGYSESPIFLVIKPKTGNGKYRLLDCKDR
jgi:hypothetical protein